MLKVLVIGVSGMLGHETFRVLSGCSNLEVFGSARSPRVLKYFPKPDIDRIIVGTDVMDNDALVGLLQKVRPNVIVNCVGLIKQLDSANDPLAALPLNSLFPHRLARLALLFGARVIQISTDCVFRGDRGGYSESDVADATDLYGRSKHLGELLDRHTVTLRTSIVGRELNGCNSLVDWFLQSKSEVKGFSNAIFSGLTTNELAHVIGNVVLSWPNLSGLWHVSSAPIDKYSLLTILNQVYKKNIIIREDPTLRIDRSLDSSRFTEATGYHAPSWLEMIQSMRSIEREVVL